MTAESTFMTSVPMQLLEALAFAFPTVKKVSEANNNLMYDA